MAKPKVNNNNLATKEDVKRLGWRLEDKIKDLEFRFNGRLTKFKNDILDGVDKVYKEVLAMRREQKAHQRQHERIDEALENHEGRLKTLEAP